MKHTTQTNQTPTTPTTQTQQLYPNNTTYVKIPNSLILYSCKLNHNILPVYLYSKTHAQYYNNNLIDTNLALMEETFYPNAKRHDQAINIKNVLKSLGTNTPSTPELEGFAQCVHYKIKIDNVKTTSRLQYYLVNDNPETDYTKITFAEYNYMVDYLNTICTTAQQSICTTAQNKSITIPDVINLYCYLKMRILQYEQLAKQKHSLYNIYMKESIAKIASHMALSNRTITKYVNLLIEMNMIKLNDNNKYNPKQENEYNLCNKWQ